VSDSKSLLESFGQHQETLREVGEFLVERYPHSPTLIALSEELKAALVGLDALQKTLGEAIDQAEREMALKLDLETQAKDSELYSRLSSVDLDRLIEYLLAEEAGFATPEQIQEFIVRGLISKPEKEFLSMFPKKLILEIGTDLTADPEGLNEFDFYQKGLDELKRRYHDPAVKDKLVKILALKLYERDPGEAVKDFYREALERVAE